MDAEKFKKRMNDKHKVEGPSLLLKRKVYYKCNCGAEWSCINIYA